MRFVTIEDIHSKFFSFTRFGQKSDSLKYASQRIRLLVLNGLIINQPNIFPKNLYLVSQKGYYFLRNACPLKKIGKPVSDVDIRTLSHDHRVTRIRILLEKANIARDWQSERVLAENEEVKTQLSSEFRPDGIYTNGTGEKVAFELEIALKSKERYRQKVKRYIEVATNEEARKTLFSKVHYVCQKENVLEILKFETQIYQSLFVFSLESEFYQPTGELL